jgi:hypothetical protein
MRKLLPGLEQGDEMADALPTALVSPCIRFRQAREPIPAVKDVKQSPEPPWVDWNMVQRGQALWQQHLGRAVLALQAVLLQGFSIGRFAEVLYQAGYAQSPLTTAQRYKATGLIVTDWFRYPLDDPDSPARQGLYAVRFMHSFARRHTGHVFDRSRGEGIALSQYDLGEVLLGFTGACLAIMENDMGMGRFAPADREAMVHVWRLIGWHLGILDEFNVADSVERVDACWADYMEWTPLRLTTCRPPTHALQRSVMQGFGTRACCPTTRTPARARNRNCCCTVAAVCSPNVRSLSLSRDAQISALGSSTGAASSRTSRRSASTAFATWRCNRCQAWPRWQNSASRCLARRMRSTRTSRAASHG